MKNGRPQSSGSCSIVLWVSAAQLVLIVLMWALSIGFIGELHVPLRAPGKYFVLGIGYGCAHVEMSRWFPPRSRRVFLWSKRSYVGEQMEWYDEQVAKRRSLNYRRFNYTHPVKGWAWVGWRARAPVWLLGLVSILPLGTYWSIQWAKYRRRRQRERQNECVECGYSLIGSYGPRCPECGSLIKPGRAEEG